MKLSAYRFWIVALSVLCCAEIMLCRESVEGYYTNNVPAKSDILRGYSLDDQLKKMEHKALQPIEGVWKYDEEMMTVAIEQFSSLRFSSHIAYRIVMLESEDLELLPGTVVGYIAESADNSKFELWIYSDKNGAELESPRLCVATLKGGSLTFKRAKELNVKVRMNIARFLPTLFRGISVTPEVKNEPLPVGFRKIYPQLEKIHNSSNTIRYL